MIQQVAAFEQAGAHLGNFAGVLATYHQSLCSAGFQRDEALVLTKDLQAILFSQAFNFGPTHDEEADEQ